MKHIQRHLFTVTMAWACLLLVLPAAVQAQEADVFEPLYSGTAAKAVETLQAGVDQAGQAEQRFALGIAQTCAAIERLTASLNRYGLNSRTTDGLRMMGMPTVAMENPAEEAIDATEFREVLGRFYQDLSQAQQTLEAVEPDGELKIVLDITRVRLDYNGDGEAGPDEALGLLMQRLQRQQASRINVVPEFVDAEGNTVPLSGVVEEEAEAEPILIALDAGDVYWLRGYCHLLMGMGDFILAHDTEKIFNHTAHLFFARVDTPYTYLSDWQPGSFDTGMIIDIISFIHLIRLDVSDPQRMIASRDHLVQVSALSRQSWEAILAETDNDREWIPSTTQNSVLGEALMVDQARLDAWMQFLDEYDAILAGKKLLPFWRGDEENKLGVNLAKVFEQPQTFDLVLWVQGSAAKSYLEEGELTTEQFWSQLTRAFRGDFMSFAVIVN